jgi:hypothetical protein
MSLTKAAVGLAASVATVTVAEIIARQVYIYRYRQQYGTDPPLEPYFLGSDGKKYIRHFTAPENWVLWGTGIGLTVVGAYKSDALYAGGLAATGASFWKLMAAKE